MCLLATNPASLLPDPVDQIFPEVVYGPADDGFDDIRNLSHKSLKRSEQKLPQNIFRQWEFQISF